MILHLCLLTKIIAFIAIFIHVAFVSVFYSGCYVHGASNPTLHRRAYHLLNPETGTALYPVSSNNNKNSMPSLVLVHYLDTKLASKNSANMIVQKNVNSLASHNRNNSLGMLGQGDSMRSMEGWDDSCNLSGNLANMTFSPQIYEHMGNAPTQMQSSGLFGVETLDFLWDVLFKEGEDKLEEALATVTGNFPVNPSMIRDMLDAKEVGRDNFREMYSYYERDNAGEDGDINTELGAIKHEQNTHENVSQPHLEMVNIIDMTPNQAFTNQETIMIISCNEPIAHPGNDNHNSTFSWHTLAAFVSVSKDPMTQCPKASAVHLTRVKTLNPYACKAQLPPFLKEDNRHVILVAVFLDSGVDALCQGVAASIALVLEQSWNEQMKNNSSSSSNWLHLSSSSRTLVQERPFIRLLTQMTNETFAFITPKLHEESSDKVKIVDVTEVETEPMKYVNDELPAPPSHMALVATALSDFPNPPVRAVLPPNTTMVINGPNDQQEVKPLYEIVDESPETKRIIKDALEATVDVDKERVTKKRSSSSIEIGPASLHDIPLGASAWANKLSNAPESETKAEELDRHCKIRFVERLNDVIAEAEPNAAGKQNRVTNLLLFCIGLSYADYFVFFSG